MITRLQRRCEREDGNAVVEFVGLSIVLLIPLVYLILMLAQVQAATFAADAVARQSARVASIEGDARKRAARIEEIVRSANSDYGVEVSPEDVLVTCTRSPCPTAGARVDVSVQVPVSLPGLGSLGMGTSIMTVSTGASLRADDAVGQAP